MSDELNIVVFVGGLSIFVASLAHLVTFLRFRNDMRRLRALQDQAREATLLPSPQASEELFRIADEMRKMVEPKHGLSRHAGESEAATSVQMRPSDRPR